MKKRRPIGIFDLGRIPVTPVQREESVGTLKQYRERLAREEQEAAAAGQRRFQSVQNDFDQTLRELDKNQKELTQQLWGRPLDCIDNPASWSGDLAADPTIGLQDAVKRFDIQTDASNLRAVAVEFEVNAKELTGYLLNEDGAKRLLYFAFAQAIHGKDLMNVAAWVTCFERLLECGCFDDGEIEFHHAKKATPRPRPVEQPEPEPTYADLEAASEMRDIHRIADRLYNLQTNDIAAAWSQSLRTNFGLSLNQEQIKAVHEWFDANPTQSWVSHRSYDLCRLALVRNGIFPPTATTAVERFSRELEGLDLTRMSFEDRRNLKRRQAAAEQEDARRFGR
jgi:hypothetical protein